jgi:DNA-binding PadR family transcriptional regulator
VTISVEKRKAAMERVLIRLAEMFWDAPRGWFGDADLAGTSPLTTTLGELEDKGWVEVVVYMSNAKPYELTKSGWYNAQRIAGRFETDEFAERRGRLCAALKGPVKGRREEAIMDCGEIAQAANIPEGWVRNVLEGQTLFLLDQERNYLVRFEDGMVTVPSTFGQLHVRLD